ncbi:hypothetical protein AB0L30_34815 [Microbispora rosea]|uniref:hypothetical protein n=1 Tax=Microbispora rosea TaxID=58117 RepID=UPI003431721E
MEDHTVHVAAACTAAGYDHAPLTAKAGGTGRPGAARALAAAALVGSLGVVLLATALPAT